jgi:hypothetical protein
MTLIKDLNIHVGLSCEQSLSQPNDIIPFFSLLCDDSYTHLCQLSHLHREPDSRLSNLSVILKVAQWLSAQTSLREVWIFRLLQQ